VEGAVEESVGDSGLAWATMLAAPEAAELGGLDGVAWRWELEMMWAGEDRGREGGGEAEDLPSPFEDLFVHDL
jgi:hypothetical protein